VRNQEIFFRETSTRVNEKAVKAMVRIRALERQGLDRKEETAGLDSTDDANPRNHRGQ
jgi:hypothetical protein